MTENMHTTGGITKIESCEYVPASVTGDCPDGTDLTDGQCRRAVALRPGALECSDGFGLVSNECIRFESPNSANPQCPSGSVEDAIGQCRRPVANQDGSYFCSDPAAALNLSLIHI